MTLWHWTPSVVVVPKPDGTELWRTDTGRRLKIDGTTGHPDLGGLSVAETDRLLAEGMIVGDGVDDAPPVRHAGMLGVPSSSLAAALRARPLPHLAVVGAGTDVGTFAKPGARHGPEVLRAFGGRSLPADGSGRTVAMADPVHGPTPLAGLRLVDIGDCFAPPDDVRGPREGIYSRIETTVESLVANGVRPLLLGGDHSVTAPAFRAVAAHRAVTLVVFDAHVDVEEPEVSTYAALSHVNVLSHVLSGRPDVEIFVLGAREPVSPQLWPLDERVTCLSIEDGVAALAALGRRDLYLSVDFDVLDPSVFPATGHPSPGGCGVGELSDAVARLGAAHDVVGCDVVECLHSPEHDYTTGRVGGHVVRRLLESMALGRVG